ncbi:hypothetical protein BJ166DRAFT_585357 [Pestalotiopsis sp. NC0098]|nr:hypothetical protein BJ166DRAFT_585357 [Pestalotiopsis sp. NC0098]
MDDDGIWTSGMERPSYKDPPVAAPSPPASSSYPPWLYTDAQRTKGKEIVSRARTARRLFEENSSPLQQPAQASPPSSQAVASEWSASSRAGPVPSPFHYRVESREHPRAGTPPSRAPAINGAISSKNALKKRLDVTIHLAFDVQEDIDDILEGFSQWYQIGNFKNSRHCFTEELKEHMENPYVLVYYMEMLLDQGHYLAIQPLSQRITHLLDLSTSSGGQNPDNDFLKAYAVLMAAFATSHGLNDIEWLAKILDGALATLELVTWARTYQGGSTEIRLMSILFRFRSRCRPQVNEVRFVKILAWAGLSDGLQTTLAKLLRDGRVWDMCLLVKAVAEANCLGLCPNTAVQWFNELVSPWKPSHDDDVGTELALLDLLVFISSSPLCSNRQDIQSGILELAGPLAEAISQRHPEHMKSRPYVRWILARVSCIARSSEGPPASWYSHTRPFDGLSYDSDTNLPIYIPIGTENPGWKQTSAGPDMLELTRLALNTALETEDYKTEAIALQTLINLSVSPDEEFEDLCHLQKVVQGDIEGYMKTLISKYLICKTDEARDQLRKYIWEQVSLPAFESSFSGGLTWLSNMLFSTLESNGQQASAARDRADKCWLRLEPGLRQAIIQKPHLTSHLFTEGAIDAYRQTMRQAGYEFASAYDVTRGDNRNQPDLGIDETWSDNIMPPELGIDENWSDTMPRDMGYHDKTADWLAANFGIENDPVSSVPQRPKPSFRKTDKPTTRRSVRFDQRGSSHKEHVHSTSRRANLEGKNEERPGEAMFDVSAERRTEPSADGAGTQMDIPPTVVSEDQDDWGSFGVRKQKKKKGKGKTEEPAPDPVEEKNDNDSDFPLFKSTKSKKDKKKAKKQAVFSWDEPEAEVDDSFEPLSASQDIESTKAVDLSTFGLWGTSWNPVTEEKGEKGKGVVEETKEPDPPAEAVPIEEHWFTGGTENDNKEKKTFSHGDESVSSERQLSVIKAEDGDESEDAPPASYQTRWPLQEVESPRSEEESTGPPARRQTF